MSSRKFNMLSLRQDQLERMSKLRAIRKTDVNAMTNEQISTLLEANSKLLTIHGHIYG